MVQKLVFFDIDGTIITEDSYEIPESAVSALKRLRENGHLSFINTGRPFSIIEDKIKAIGFDGYICSCGAYIRFGDEILLHKTLDPERSKEIVALVREYDLDVIFESPFGICFDLTRPIGDRALRYKARFDSLGMDTNVAIDFPGFHFDKFIVWTHEGSDIARFRAALEKDFDCIDRGNSLYEFVPMGFSKASGIKFVTDRLGASLDNCYALGDSTNDLSMLSYVPHGIAMGGSPEALLQSVSFVTKNIRDDGLAYALRHFGLI